MGLWGKDPKLNHALSLATERDDDARIKQLKVATGRSRAVIDQTNAKGPKRASEQN